MGVGWGSWWLGWAAAGSAGWTGSRAVAGGYRPSRRGLAPAHPPECCAEACHLAKPWPSGQRGSLWRRAARAAQRTEGDDVIWRRPIVRPPLRASLHTDSPRSSPAGTSRNEVCGTGYTGAANSGSRRSSFKLLCLEDYRLRSAPMSAPRDARPNLGLHILRRCVQPEDPGRGPRAAPSPTERRGPRRNAPKYSPIPPSSCSRPLSRPLVPSRWQPGGDP